MIKFLTTTFFTLGLAVFWCWPNGEMWAATALETVVAECQTRTGFGESTCMTLVKKYMNVERCKEYTGFSDEECAAKIEEIQNDPGFIDGGTNTPPPTLPDNPATPTIIPPGTVESSELIRAVRAKKEAELLLLWQRTNQVTEYLKGKGLDTGSVEARFPTFEAKAEALLAAYDTYLSTFEGTFKETEAVRKNIRSGARIGIDNALTDLARYYRSDILGPLQAMNK